MGNFVVSARKYRPTHFDEVVGQQHVTDTLKNAILKDHLAHAFLFCGPRGVGKTTCARILAKVLNCVDLQENATPCNACSSCNSFASQSSFNIFELDAASNNSVEHIRNLIEQVRFQPQVGQYKIFIIDEVHMLSQQAFNAFLKTLEEPPSYAIFILATTEKHKILPTILSRCQIFDFRRIQVAEIIPHLESICITEGIQAEETALNLIAQKADGALRDALSIFDRMVSSSKELSYQSVIENLNILDYDYYIKLNKLLATSNIPESLMLYDQILRKGFDPEVFLAGLGEHFRNVLVAKFQKTQPLLTFSGPIAAAYTELSKSLPTDFLLTCLQIVNEADIHFKTARNPRLHLEMAIIKMASIALAQKNEPSEKKNLIPEPKAIPKKAGTETIAEAKTPSTTESKPFVVSDKAPSKPTLVEEPKPVLKKSIGSRLKAKKSGLSLDAIQNQLKEAEAEKEKIAKAALPFTIENVKVVWSEYIQSTGSPSLKAIMEGAELAIKNNVIAITVASNFAKQSIVEQLDLLEMYQKRFYRSDLRREVLVDETKQVEKPVEKTSFTPKEKYEQMVSKNPLLEQLNEKFKLKIDTKD